MFRAYLAGHKQMAASIVKYRDLLFEERADHLAYPKVMKNCKQAS